MILWYNGSEVKTMDVLERLSQYNADELYYQAYYNCTDEEQRLALIERIGRDEIICRGLLTPEVNDNFLTPFDMGECIFVSKGKQHIWLSKHNRYTPEFLHSHTYFELIYVLSGSCSHTISGETVRMEQGCFCIVAPKVYHSIGVFDDSVVLNILVRKSTLEEYYPSLLKGENIVSEFFMNGIFAKEHTPFLMFHIGDENTLHDLILEMYREQLENESYSEEIISSMMQVFLYRLVRYGNMYAVQSESVHSSDATKIYRYFLTEYRTASLTELARQLGFTPTYCSVYVKKATGQNFSQLHKRFRFRKAKELLKNTSLSIASIGEAVGYSDSENFIIAFQNEYGISPSVYRKSNNDI